LQTAAGHEEIRMSKKPEDISPHHSACRHCDSPAEHDAQKFVFGVDLDGVCADLFAGLRPIAAKWTGRPLKSLTKKPSWGLPEWGIPGCRAATTSCTGSP
jgi:5'' nucleotidase, deoxy (Pyrimidine), cytosolic type C protein (NT5C).